MVTNSNPKSFLVCVILLMATTVTFSTNEQNHKTKETKMTLFFQDFSGGPNATVSAVAGIPGKPRNFSQFGTIFVLDDPITEGVQLNSTEIGRDQGLFGISSLDGANAYDIFSFVFTNEMYNGSTLEGQGRSIELAKVREVSIVSGTKKFRFARGYATLETVLLKPSINYSVIRCNITVRQPMCY